MRSVEGDATMDWPQSPPIQDLSFESRGEFDVVLGLGQAGTSHWSSSFKSCPEELSIEAEHACRAKCDVQMLGCRYQVSKNWQIELVNGSIGLLNPEVQNRLQIMSSNIETIEKQEFVCRPCLDTANSGDLQTFIWQMGVQIIN